MIIMIIESNNKNKNKYKTNTNLQFNWLLTDKPGFSPLPSQPFQVFLFSSLVQTIFIILYHIIESQTVRLRKTRLIKDFAVHVR